MVMSVIVKCYRPAKALRPNTNIA